MKKRSENKIFSTVLKYIPVAAAPLLTAAVTLYVFWLKGLYPFGQRTAAWCDMNQQVVPLFCQFKDILDGKSGMFLSMKNASGMNFWGVFFFFLASPFTFLVKFVEKSDILVFMDILIVIKMSLCAAAGSLYFVRCREFKRLGALAQTMLGFAYALSGYTMLFYQNIIWLDIMYLFPILLISLERMKRTGSPVMYSVMLALMMAVNYYLGYMLVLFLLLTMGVCAAYSLRGGKEIPVRTFRSFVIGSAAAALLSAVVWLPCFIQYLSSGRRGGLIQNLRTGFFVTDFDTVLPILMCSGTVIALTMMDLGRKEPASPRHRLTKIMALLLTIPIFIEPINKMWHTGSYMAFPSRYAFMSIFMLLILCAYELDRPAEYKGKLTGYIVSGTFSLAALIVYFISSTDYIDEYGDTLSDYTKSLSGSEGSFKGLAKLMFMSLICAGVILLLYRRGRLVREFALVLLTAVIAVEGIGNVKIYMTYSAERNEDTNYAQREVTALGDRIDDGSFYRVKTNAKIFDYNMIGGMGYDSIAHYTSLTSEDYMFTMKRLGYTSVWMEVGSCGGTELTDAMLSIGYRLSNVNEKDSIFDYRGYHIAPLENKLPLGFFPSGTLKEDLPQTADRIDVQEYIAENIFGDGGIVERYYPQEDNIKHSGGRYKVKASETLSYRIRINGSKTLYFDCFDKLSNSLSEPTYNSFTVLVNGSVVLYNYPNSKENGVLKVGSFQDEVVTVSLAANKDVDVSSLGVFSVDTDRLSAAAGGLTQQEGLKEVKNGFVGTLTADTPRTVMLSLPYDEGYTVKVNGRRTEIRRVLGAFTAFELPEGESEITVSFRPVGLTSGAVMSLAGAVLLVVVAVWQKKGIALKAPGERPFTDMFCRILILVMGILVIAAVYVLPAAVNIIFWKKQ